MNSIRDVLQDLNRRLDLPQPEKSQVLLEISGNLHDARQHYKNKGFSEEEATQKAIEMFSISSENLHHLQYIHYSFIRKLTNRLSHQVQSRWERVLFSIILVFTFYYSGFELLTFDFFQYAGATIIPLIAVSSIAFSVGLWKFYILFIKKDHNIAYLNTGLSFLLFLSGVSLFMGFYTVIMNTWFILEKVTLDIHLAPELCMNTLITSATIMMTALLSTMAIALVWFIFMNRVSTIEQAEAAFLLERR